jgi:glucose/arabinose dehydrogenase
MIFLSYTFEEEDRFHMRTKLRKFLPFGVLLAALPLISALPGKIFAQTTDSGQPELRMERILSGLNGAWGFDFLPDTQVVLTEKRGRLFVLGESGQKQRVSGLPNIVARGQGGLLDVAVARDFETSQEIFLTYVTSLEDGVGTAVAVAKLDYDQARLTEVRTIFEMSGGDFGDRHFGSRIKEAADGTLYVTIGDRGDRESAQDLSRHNGSVLRLNRDGSVPKDNPFQNSQAPEIWSYGHRNPQGLDIASDGTIWAVEHGARGGDEVNVIEKGNNYGWPVISYGTHYSGGKIGEGTSKAGMEQPEFYWDPSIAPSGLMVYEGDMFPEWQGDIFVGSLKFDYISRLSGQPFREVQQIETPETRRVRDVREAPDGSIWFISEDRDAIYRLSR